MSSENKIQFYRTQMIRQMVPSSGHINHEQINGMKRMCRK